MTKLLGVMGDPIAHSLSPLIHNGWIRELGYNATYEAMHVSADDFPSALRTLATRDVLGVNVTLPHKTTALEVASVASKAAQKIGAANTLTYRGSAEWTAENTDAPGFLKALGPINPLTEHAVILGAGGSARAILYALVNRGVRVTLLNRTVSKAEALAVTLGDRKTAYGDINSYTEYLDSATIVINTTSMGYSGDILSLPVGGSRRFFDISYGKISARQLDHAKLQGWETQDGLSMLVAQAAFSFEIWFGEVPDIETGLARCRRAMEAIG